MSRKQVILVGGGVRSGKSAFALSLARRLGARRTFLATAQALDAEMQQRIAQHLRERGNEFETIEEAFAVAPALARLRETDVAVVDCLTLWLSNLLLRDESELRILAQVDELAAVLEQRRFHVILVTNEVGMGVVPETALGRAFRDLAGRVHQKLARTADEIYFAALGSMLRLLPGPVELETFGGSR